MKKTLIALMGALFLTTLSNGNLFAQDDEDGFTVGGAVRYNIIATDYYDSESNATNPEFTWDTWRLNVDGSMSGIDLSFEYRFYPTFGTHFIHHGYLGYDFGEDVYMELGVTQVPFGLETYASNSWWFNGNYYVGLEDDYDMGINFDITPSEKLTISLAYFRQAEPGGPWEAGGNGSYLNNGDWGSYGVSYGTAGPGRYSYDVVPGSTMMPGDTAATGVSLLELNQFNARVAFDITEDIEIGGSAQMGQLYNFVQDVSDWTTAFAGHVDGSVAGVNFKAQYSMFDYTATADDGSETDFVQMGAYGSVYDVITKANMYTASVAYPISVDWGPISSISPHIDYTFIDKTNEDFYDTQHFIPGILVTAGSVYTYIDYAMGKNQPWLTGDFGKGLGTGVEDPDWNARFNVNIGYYF
ncbi:MAG: hypothetical protein K9I29_09450 [Bacteroidales bacterium]|nr:hypothetical protein [Bacteroidales bacterium]